MSKTSTEYSLLDREISWLHFSHRVLQEAMDPSVPLLERLFFCGIFSSNLDEFFRVRVASLRTLLRAEGATVEDPGATSGRLLHEIHRIVLAQQEEYGGIIGGLWDELAAEGIRRVDEKTLPAAHHDFVRSYFDDEVAHLLQPVVFTEGDTPPFLKNHAVYLVIEVWETETDGREWVPHFALCEVPEALPRFVTLEGEGGEDLVLFLDDVIRFNLDRLLPQYEAGRAYAVKLTRDADLHIDDEFDGEVVDAIRENLKNRETGLPSRFLYDMRAPYVLVHLLQHRLGLSDEDMVLGARYHNLSDYMGFPRFGRDELSFPEWPALPHPTLDDAPSVLDAIREKDRIIHTPYQSFDHVVRFLDEAAADEAVEEVWLTVYRVARESSVLKALIRAAEAGKKVVVFMEVQARFDEESNLFWADRLKEAGVRTLFSMKGLKVHAKIAMVVRAESDGRRRYAYVGTGNFNEKTARIYADHGIFTADERITKDVEQVFHFLNGDVEEPETEHLLVAPFTLRKGFNRLIRHEEKRAAEGRPSGMTLKMNSLQDEKIIRRLYDASVAGVPIDVIVRGICCLVPGVKGQSETISIRSILDRLLEHARIYRFHADGDETMYLASADWMKRNLSSRIEVAIPVYDPDARRELQALLDIQMADTAKARVIDAEGANRYVAGDRTGVRAQQAFRDYVARLADGSGVEAGP